MVSSRLASLFVLWIGVYLVLCLLTLYGVHHALKRHGRTRGVKHGMLSPVTWPWPMKGFTSLMLLLYCVIPSTLILTCFISGPFMAAVEGWGALIGIEYLLTVALALPEPLTNVTPESTAGKFIDALVSMWVMLVGAVCSGFVAQTVLITKLAELMPESRWGFYRFVLLYVPIFILLFAAFSGGLLAGLEGWSYSDGFFYMAGQASGAVIVAISPRTVHGAVISCIFSVVEFGIIGAIFGLVVVHPYAIAMSNSMEGIPPDPPPLEEMDLTELNKVFKEQQENIKKQQDQMAKLQKTIKQYDHQGDYPVGEYKIVIRGTVVTATESIHSATVAELPLGTLVTVLEIRDLKADHRVRGRIQEPAGWISLRHTGEGYSWVMPKNIPSKAAAPPSQDEIAAEPVEKASEPPPQAAKAVELSHTHDWAAQLNEKVKGAEISSKHEITVTGKDGSQHNSTWNGDSLELDPAPGPSSFPLKVEAKEPDPRQEELKRHNAQLLARIEQLEAATPSSPATSIKQQRPASSFFQCWGEQDHHVDALETVENESTVEAPVVLHSLSQAPGMLAGKTAVITGAGKGMGRAIALAYMKEGANLILVARIQSELETVAHECANLGPAYRIKVFPADLSKRKAVDDLADYVLRKSRGCDVLVNAAGTTSCGDAIGELDGWDEMLYLNLNGVIRLTSRLTPSMVEKKAGVIINMGNIAIVDDASDTTAVFTASKDGLRGWSDSIYTGLQHENIKVVLVNPALVLHGDSKLTDAISSAIPPEDVAEICLLPFKLPSGAVPSEVTLRLTSGAQPKA